MNNDYSKYRKMCLLCTDKYNKNGKYITQKTNAQGF